MPIRFWVVAAVLFVVAGVEAIFCNPVLTATPLPVQLKF